MYIIDYTDDLEKLAYEIERFDHATEVMHFRGEKFPVGMNYQEASHSLAIWHADQYFGHTPDSFDAIEALGRKRKFRGEYFDLRSLRVEDKIYYHPDFSATRINKLLKSITQKDGTMQITVEKIYRETIDTFIDKMLKKYINESERSNYSVLYDKYYAIQEEKLKIIPFTAMPDVIRKLIEEIKVLIDGNITQTTENVAKAVANTRATIERIHVMYKDCMAYYMIDRKPLSNTIEDQNNGDVDNGNR